MEVSLPWSKGTHALEGGPTVKASLKTGDEAIARIRWTHVHAQMEGLVQMGHVLVAEMEQRRQAQRTAVRLPPGTVATIAAQARHDLLAEHDRTWIDPTFTSPLMGVVVQLMRKAGRAASLDLIDEARRFANALRLREATGALASRDPGVLDRQIEEAEITDPQLIAALHDVATRRADRLTPEQNVALSAVCATSRFRANSTVACRRTASICPKIIRTAAPSRWLCSGRQ